MQNLIDLILHLFLYFWLRLCYLRTLANLDLDILLGNILILWWLPDPWLSQILLRLLKQRLYNIVSKYITLISILQISNFSLFHVIFLLLHLLGILLAIYLLYCLDLLLDVIVDLRHSSSNDLVALGVLEHVVRSRVVDISVRAVFLPLFRGGLDGHNLPYVGLSILEEVHQPLMLFPLPLLLLLSVGLEVLDNVSLEFLMLFLGEALVVVNLILEIWPSLFDTLEIGNRHLNKIVTDLTIYHRVAFGYRKVISLGKQDLLRVTHLFFVWHNVTLTLHVPKLRGLLIWVKLDLLAMHLWKVDPRGVLSRLHTLDFRYMVHFHEFLIIRIWWLWLIFKTPY